MDKKQHLKGINPGYSRNADPDLLLQLFQKFFNSSHLSRISILVSGVHMDKQYSEIVVWDEKQEDEVPVKEFLQLFQSLGDRYYGRKIRLSQQTTIRKGNNTTPKSECCNSKMYAKYKPSEFFAGVDSIDYLYCDGCKRKLDGNGKIIQPEQLHTDGI